MSDTPLILKEKFYKSFREANLHFERLETAISEFSGRYSLPITQEIFSKMIMDTVGLAFADQIIYRFSKTHDTLGARVFKDFLYFQGDSSNRPFLDILNNLEKISILNTEDWFVLREIRNEIAHDYENSNQRGYQLLNEIYEKFHEFRKILKALSKYID